MSNNWVKLCAFKKFYTFPAFTLDYTDIIWQFLSSFCFDKEYVCSEHQRIFLSTTILISSINTQL